MIKDFDFEIIEGILPDDLITELREICIEYKNQNLNVLGDRKMYGSGQHWRGIDMASKFPGGEYNGRLYSIYTSALLHEIIRRYLSPVYLFNNQIVVKLPHEEFEFEKHKDNQYNVKDKCNSVTLMLILDDFTDENGTLSLETRKGSEVKIYPKRGDVVVINGETYHWSSKNRTDEPRCTFIAHYTDESIKDFMWYNKLFIEK